MKSIELLTLEAKFALLNALDSTWIEKLIAKIEVEDKSKTNILKTKVNTLDDNIDM
jgi:hypothetical protein